MHALASKSVSKESKEELSYYFMETNLATEKKNMLKISLFSGQRIIPKILLQIVWKNFLSWKSEEFLQTIFHIPVYSGDKTLVLELLFRKTEKSVQMCTFLFVSGWCDCADLHLHDLWRRHVPQHWVQQPDGHRGGVSEGIHHYIDCVSDICPG